MSHYDDETSLVHIMDRETSRPLCHMRRLQESRREDSAISAEVSCLEAAKMLHTCRYRTEQFRTSHDCVECWVAFFEGLNISMS